MSGTRKRWQAICTTLIDCCASARPVWRARGAQRHLCRPRHACATPDSGRGQREGFRTPIPVVAAAGEPAVRGGNTCNPAVPKLVWGSDSMRRTPMNDRTSNRLDELVARSRREQAEREQGYREQALKMYPWVCGRCGREFTHANVRELTVHHRDHNHDNNPPDGSNWELLCVYCHDNEHQRYVDQTPGGSKTSSTSATHNPFAGLADLLNRDDESK